MNGFTVNGRLTREPNARTTQQGDTVVDIDIADSWKDRQGNEQVAYYRASFWNNAGRTIQNYFHQGDPITLVGVLRPRTYQDRNGNNRMSLDIERPQFGFVPAPPKNRNNQGNYQQNNQGYQQPPQGQPNNGYQQPPQQAPQQPQNNSNGAPNYSQQTLGNNNNSWENTSAGQKRAQVNQQGQAQEISDNDLPFPTQNQETPF